MKTVRWLLVAFGLVLVVAVAVVALGFAVNRSVSLAQTLLAGPAEPNSTAYNYGLMGPRRMNDVWQDDGGTTVRRGPGMMGYGWGDDSDADARYGPGMMGYGWGDGPGGSVWHGPGMMGYGWDDDLDGDTWPGPGMMGYDREGMPCGGGYVIPGEGPVSSLEDAESAIHAYVERLGYEGLDVTEIMEFEHNYYAIVAEQETGIGAMELLVDKDSGTTRPEPGPNMMWNAEYGMHAGASAGWGGMMGPGWGGAAASGEMSVSRAEAEGIAQAWLDANLPGRTAGEADPFYGYYTLHFLVDGEIDGMLSVHGASGDVWFHSWHGDFVRMVEGH